MVIKNVCREGILVDWHSKEEGLDLATSAGPKVEETPYEWVQERRWMSS